MNSLMAQFCFRRARRWLPLLAGLLALTGVRAAAPPQADRFLLVFETSHALKKNLPAIRATLDRLFSSNLQNEMRVNDDLAVWTVDERLHTDTFPLASWAPADAEAYSARLQDFLRRQRFPWHASLAALQPLLNRVMKDSDRLTVLIFCDSQSRLLGTPYDSGVNEIITNAVARVKGDQPMFVVVLRSDHGEYLGCSVNRSLPLNFPKFPPPPKPAPPPKVAPLPTAEPAAKVEPQPVPAVVVPPVPALIIVGTNAGTNLSVLTNLAPAPAPVPAPKATVTANTPVANAMATKPPPAAAPASEVVTSAPAPKMVAAVPAQPASVSNPPAAVPVLPTASAPALVAAAAPAVVTNQPPASPANTMAVSAPETETASDTNSRWPLVLGGGLLAVAAGLVIWLAARSRRPRGSLITSSLQDDPRLPPRK